MVMVGLGSGTHVTMVMVGLGEGHTCYYGDGSIGGGATHVAMVMVVFGQSL